MRRFALCCKAVLHRVTDWHCVSQEDFSMSLWLLCPWETVFYNARPDSSEALGPRPEVNERTSVDFSWNRIKPFKHAVKRLSKAYELEPGIYQGCVILYVEIRQQLCFHRALARNQGRLGAFNWLSHGVKLEEIFLQHPVGRNLVVAPPLSASRFGRQRVALLWRLALQRLLSPFICS